MLLELAHQWQVLSFVHIACCVLCCTHESRGRRATVVIRCATAACNLALQIWASAKISLTNSPNSPYRWCAVGLGDAFAFSLIARKTSSSDRTNFLSAPYVLSSQCGTNYRYDAPASSSPNSGDWRNVTVNGEHGQALHSIDSGEKCKTRDFHKLRNEIPSCNLLISCGHICAMLWLYINTTFDAPKKRACAGMTTRHACNIMAGVMWYHDYARSRP